MITSILFITNSNLSIDSLTSQLVDYFPSSLINYECKPLSSETKKSFTSFIQKKSNQYDLIVLDCRELHKKNIAHLEAIRTLFPEKMILIKTNNHYQLSFQERYPSFFPSYQAESFHTLLQSDNSENEWLADCRNTLELRKALKNHPINIPNWHPQKLLHTTPQSVIYFAQNKQQQKGAIKLFSPPQTRLTSLEIDTFLNEASIFSKIKSAFIVGIIDYGVDHKTPYIIMEYIETKTLKQFIENPMNINIKQSLQFFSSILNAIQTLHQNQLLHRDIKPSNIMLKKDGSIVLIDCGIESNWLIATKQIKEEEVYCTPFYVSPERAASEACTIRSEIYSLGILFYEIITGYKPYDGISLIDIIKAHALAPIPSLPIEAGAYQPLFEKMVAKHPDGRYSSIDHIIQDFEQIKQSHYSFST